MKRFISPVAGLILGATASAGAFQTVIPQELLELDRQRCFSDCQPGFGEQVCTVLCDCTVSQFKKRLDFQKYLDLSAQLSRNELTAESRTFLDSVASYCTAELEKQGIEIGGGQEAAASGGPDAP